MIVGGVSGWWWYGCLSVVYWGLCFIYVVLDDCSVGSLVVFVGFWNCFGLLIWYCWGYFFVIGWWYWWLLLCLVCCWIVCSCWLRFFWWFWLLGNVCLCFYSVCIVGLCVVVLLVFVFWFGLVVGFVGLDRLLVLVLGWLFWWLLGRCVVVWLVWLCWGCCWMDGCLFGGSCFWYNCVDFSYVGWVGCVWWYGWLCLVWLIVLWIWGIMWWCWYVLVLEFWILVDDD